MRCFFGLSLPEAYQQGLRDLTAQWKPRLRSKLSWTRPGNWHLTLKFLGDVQPERLEALMRSFHEPLGERFVLQGQGGGIFPGQRRPRVLWVGVGKGEAEIQSLVSRIEQRCAAHGFVPDTRPFRPHLTVGRIRQHLDDPWSDILNYMGDLSWPEINVDRIVLWKSDVRPQGPSYMPLAEYGLEGGSRHLTGSR